MDRVSESKACRSCAMSKRRCGKQTPTCLRCRTRGIACTYPPSKPSSFVLCTEDTPDIEPESPPSSSVQILKSSYTSGTGDDSLSSGLGIDLSALSNTLRDDQLASTRFPSLETWEVRFPTAVQDSLSIPDLKRFVARILRWLAEWVEKGSNPFIHSRLYRTRFPRCVQDAYAALSCYFHRNSSNEQIAFRIIEDRLKNLLTEYGNQSENITSIQLDPLEHIARVHALLIYQIIGLFDGDIRLRYLSETSMPVLHGWMQEMVHYASQNECLGGHVVSTLDGANLLWHSWILGESARRTWVVVSGIQAVFTMLQQRVVACQGGMVVTIRQGIWEAQSSVAWQRLCLEDHLGLIQMAEVDRIFTDIVPNEVDEFAKVALEVVFGREKIDSWGIRAEESTVTDLNL